MKVIHLQGQKALGREDRPRTLSPFGKSHSIPVGANGSGRNNGRQVDAVHLCIAGAAAAPGTTPAEPRPRSRPAALVLTKG